MLQDGKILVGKGEKEAYILPKMANRHGLISGATGTGKTITLKVMAESFSSLGVPVFLADIKGDLSGCCKPGTGGESLDKRLRKLASIPNRFLIRGFLSVSGMFSGKRGIRSERRSATWALRCSRASLD